MDAPFCDMSLVFFGESEDPAMHSLITQGGGSYRSVAFSALDSLHSDKNSNTLVILTEKQREVCVEDSFCGRRWSLIFATVVSFLFFFFFHFVFSYMLFDIVLRLILGRTSGWSSIMKFSLELGIHPYRSIGFAMWSFRDLYPAGARMLSSRVLRHSRVFKIGKRKIETKDVAPWILFLFSISSLCLFECPARIVVGSGRLLTSGIEIDLNILLCLTLDSLCRNCIVKNMGHDLLPLSPSPTYKGIS